MKKLCMLFLAMLMVAAITGCNSSTGDEEDLGGNNTGNGGTFTVSGSVTLTNAGAGISGATVTLTSVGNASTTLLATTNTSGDYSFSNIADGSYLLTVTKTGYSFSPEYATIAVSAQNITVSTFMGTAINTNGNAGSNTLYPLKTGATWTYASHTDVAGLTYDETVTNTVKGTTSQGGVTYWEIGNVTRNTDNEIETDDVINFRIANDILYSYYTDFAAAKLIPTAAKAAQASAFRAARAMADDYPLFKFGVSANTTWTVYSYSGSYGGTSSSVIITAKYVGTETVGAYTDCAKYEITNETEYSYSGVPGAYRQFTTYWLAPNVGPIKQETLYYTGASLDAVTLLDTVTYTLTSHNIP